MPDDSTMTVNDATAEDKAVVGQAKRRHVLEEVFSNDKLFDEYLHTLSEHPYTRRMENGREVIAAKSPFNIAEIARARDRYGYKHCERLRTEQEIARMGGQVIRSYRTKGIFQARGKDRVFVWPDVAIERAHGEAGRRYNPARYRGIQKKVNLDDDAMKAEFALAAEEINADINALSDAAGYVFCRRYGIEIVKPDRPEGLDLDGIRDWCSAVGVEVAAVCAEVDENLKRIRRAKAIREKTAVERMVDEQAPMTAKDLEPADAVQVAPPPLEEPPAPVEAVAPEPARQAHHAPEPGASGMSSLEAMRAAARAAAGRGASQSHGQQGQLTVS